MSELSRNKRWVIYTGLILWGLTILLTFNTIVSLKVLANVSVEVLPGLDITALALILILFAVVNILTWRKRSKLMERTRYTLPLAILVAFYVVAWILNFIRSILSLKDLIEILYFAIIFSTVFTAVVIPVSLYIYRRRWRIFNLTNETKQRGRTS